MLKKLQPTFQQVLLCTIKLYKYSKIKDFNHQFLKPTDEDLHLLVGFVLKHLNKSEKL